MNSTVIKIEPYVQTVIGNYSSSYTVDAGIGLQLYPTFSYPECPTFKGPETVPSSTDIGCKLYDNNGNIIKSLTACKIVANDL
jgi:hypothetical protein